MKIIKKNRFIIAAVIFSITSGAHASTSSALDHTWYLGGNLGWSSYHHDGDFTKGKNNNKLGTAGFIGYQFSPYIALETGYNILGQEQGVNGYKSDIEGWQLTGKFSYPINPDINIYTRAGGMLYRNDITNNNDSSDDSSGLAPVAAVGGEYYFGGHWTARVEYQWVEHLGSGDATPDNGYLSIGATYHFMPKPVAIPVHSSEPIDIAVSQNAELPSESIFFDYNQSSLNEQNKSILEDFYHREITNKKQSVKIQSLGYADTIGSTRNNNLIAKRRAENTGFYLSSLGVNSSNIKIDTVGETSQFDKEDCKKYSHESQRKNCMSLDRRVTVSVSPVN